jgi:hypothetical protein
MGIFAIHPSTESVFMKFSFLYVKVVFGSIFLLLINIDSSQSQTIRINEVMASNSDFYPDEDGSFADWIELHNAGDESVSLLGYGLSDSPDNPFKWVFPDYTMQPGEYLAVWASGKDRRSPPGQWQTGIKRRYYPGIGGTSVDDLINHHSFPHNPATRHIITDHFEAPVNIANDYGQHMFTWLVAPQTGNYIFRIASDDNSILYLSSDDSPENAQVIARVDDWTNSREWFKYPSQTSAPVFLTQGKRYYLSALMKEGQGGDNLAVSWNMPDGTQEIPISARHCFLPTGSLHTNFSIDALGEEITLTSPDSARVDYVPAIRIPTNISYGRVSDQPDQWAYFNTPTPGSSNNTQTFSDISPGPLLDPHGGVFPSQVMVSITVDDPDAQIYYTTNGSTPNAENGTLYKQPFVVQNTSYVRAIAISSGKLDSEISGATYSIAQGELAGFTSDLPLLVIHSFNTPIKDGDRTPAWMTIIEPGEDGRANLTREPALGSRIAINLRGSSSLSFPKKGYGFHIREEDDSNRKVSLLGMPEEHNWVLHGPYSDKSLMRNALAYAIGEDAGHYSPRARFVELFMHTGTGQLREPHYHGVYVLIERIKVAPGRVEVEDLELHHNEYPQVSGGYVFKIDRLNSGESGLRTARNNQFVFVRPDEASISQPQKDYLKSYLDSLETALFGSQFTNPENGYAAFMDVMSFIDMHLITELAKEIDGFRLSTFFHKERQGKVRSGPLWDFNLSFGNADYHNGWIPSGWYYPGISEYDYNRGWYNRLFLDPAFAEQYKRRYRSLRLTAFSEIHLLGRINDNHNQLREAQERNFNRWKILGKHIWPNWYVAKTYDEEIAWMSNWLRQRLLWMDGQLGQPYTMMHYWNLNSDAQFTPTYTIANATLSLYPAPASDILTGTGQDFKAQNARNSDKAHDHLRINNPVGTEMVMHLSSENYQNLIFSYEARRSTNGANRHYISYSTDGEEYIALDTLNITEKPQLQQLDLMDVPGVNNNPLLSIKITIGYDPIDSGGTGGNNRFDNITLDGEAFAGTILPPVQTLMLDDHIELIEGGDNHTLKLSDYFVHPSGQPLEYQITQSLPEVATIHIENNQMVITPVKRGGTRIGLRVSDGVNPPIERSFYLLVYPRPVELQKYGYIFNSWSPDEPEGSFPPHMIFTQSGMDDPKFFSPFPHAYTIPEDDYASGDTGNIGFPYRNTSRSRINGLNDNGISFINTGRGRDVGAAIVAIDTRAMESFEFAWKASTLASNSRAYNLRLQYRVGLRSRWKDWLDENGVPVEYQRTNYAVHSQTFTSFDLPPDAVGKPYVQLRWLYHFTGEQLNPGSGTRDMLALNMISLNPSLNSRNEFTGVQSLRAYPNPTTGDIVNFNKTTSGSLFDIGGRKILSINNQDRINTRGIDRGIYLFRSDEGETIKLFIQQQGRSAALG